MIGTVIEEDRNNSSDDGLEPEDTTSTQPRGASQEGPSSANGDEDQPMPPVDVDRRIASRAANQRAPQPYLQVFFLAAGWQESFPHWLAPWLASVAPGAPRPSPAPQQRGGQAFDDAQLLAGYRVVQLPLRAEPGMLGVVTAYCAASLQSSYCKQCFCALHPFFHELGRCYYCLTDGQRQRNDLPGYPSHLPHGRLWCHSCGQHLPEVRRASGTCSDCRARLIANLESALSFDGGGQS